MEANPLESVRNNVLATKVLAQVAVEFEAKRFVLISTDKALNAQAVYGQSKALCEWIVEAYGARDDVATRFVAVRFGNVLDSAGSVIRIFKKQIAKGGPGDGHEPGDDALLHDDARGGVARDPGRLDRRARRDLRPGHGRAGQDPRPRAQHDPALRARSPSARSRSSSSARAPGEKLHEELWGKDEVVTETGHPKIHRARRAPVDGVWLEDELRALEALVDDGETLEAVSRLSAMVRSPQRVGVPRDRHGFGTDSSLTPADPRSRVARCSTPSSSVPSRPSAGRSASLPAPAPARRRRSRTGSQIRSRAGLFAPDEILAVTFTDKAAGEMRGRLEQLGVPGVRVCDLPRGRARAAPVLRRRAAGADPRLEGAPAPLHRRTRSRGPTASGRRPTSRPRSNGRRTGASRPPAIWARWESTSRRSRRT